MKKRAVALGYFDGLHIAHMKVLGTALEQKKNGLDPAVLLFDRHPAEVLFGADVPRLLTAADRDSILREMGVKPITVSFEEIKDLSPEAFVRDVLVSSLGCGFVSCGYNYRFGREGAGGEETLRTLCRAYGVTVSVSAQISVGQTPVSSSAIRGAVRAGNMEIASAMLGRPFTFEAQVCPGEHRGRSLGAPTVNLPLPQGIVVPRFGVYASVAEFGGKKYAAVTDIGNRPTFGGQSVRSETFIMDYSGDLYGRNVRLHLLSFLRDEKKFPSSDTLKAQISMDAVLARQTVEHSAFFQK